MPQRPEFTTFAVEAGELGVLRWPGRDGAPTIVTVHGITANAWSWDPLVHQLDGAVETIAVDLRGRGRSWELPPPFGIRRHADDVAHVIRQLDRGPVVVVGHSMGAYVTLALAERNPELVADVLLVDGGTPLPVPLGADVDELLELTLGPAIQRLRQVWADRVSYMTMWQQHPAFAEGIGIDLERNLLADLVEVDGGLRTAVNEDAVRQDGRELLSDRDVRELLDRRRERTTIIRAPYGLMGDPPPLIGDEMVARFRQHEWVDVPDTNHYTVLLGQRGARTVADAVVGKLATVGG